MKLISLFSIIFFLFLWELLVQSNVIDKTFFPAPFMILKHTSQLFFEGNLITDLLYSFKRLLFSVIIIVPLSSFAAYSLTRFKYLELIFKPFIYLSYPLPKIALFPLLLVLFGIDDSAKIALISIGMFFPLFIQLNFSLNRLFESKKFDLIRIYKISGFQYWINFIAKGLLNDFLIGFTNSVNYGLTLVVISEINVSKNGLGNGLWKSWDQFRIEDMYSYILIISLVGLAINLFLQYLINQRQSISSD